MLDGHSNFGCSLKDMFVIEENRKILISSFKFKCRMCNGLFDVETGNDGENNYVNTDFVLGITNMGSGFSHMQQLCSAMDVPCMSKRHYSSTHETVSNIWEKASIEAMKAAAEEEKALAIEAGVLS